ncbi:MAG: hypothetical protein NZ734_12725 [Paracoccus sp.]|nr:hypothetical protein [Paracoccus sp. (in: a-proteobacteria)]
MIEASSSPVTSICPPNSSCCIITIGSAPRHMAAAKSKGFIGSSMYSAPKPRDDPGQDMARIWPGYGQDFRKWNSDQYLPENRQDEKRPNDVTGDGLTPVTPVFADM